MINLLPYQHRDDLRAARTNTMLLRYNMLLIAAAFFLIAAVALVYVFLANMRESAENTIALNTSKEQDYSKVKSDASDFQAKLADAKQLFDNQLLYSKALVRYADLFPSSTAVDGLKLDSTSFSTPTTISVKVTGAQATRDLSASFESSPYVTNFQRKKISVSTDSKYPYTVEVSFLLKKEIAQ